jgi:hypothetical protein
LESLKETEHSEDEDVDDRIILKWIVRKLGGKMCNGFIWFGIATCSGLL